MQSFRRSHGRILFEVLCTFVIAASCAGGWLQSGAWALLVTSSVVALYGVVHAFDLVRRDPAETVEAQRIMVQAEPETDLPASQFANPPMEVAEDQQLPAGNGVRALPFVEPPASRPKAGRPAKSARKGGGRRASTPKEAKITELAPPEAEVVTELALPAEGEVTVEEAAHIAQAPLFEPAPFVRQQRAAFGRKTG